MSLRFIQTEKVGSACDKCRRFDVGLEMDLPVIIMSADGDTLKGIQ
jgi:hypothetical protein